jgi:hypothetical protein
VQADRRRLASAVRTEDMLGWETAEQTRTDPRELEFAGLWNAIPKVVLSSILTTGGR